MDVAAAIQLLVSNAGDLWFAAVISAFFVMICESAKPKPADGEARHAPQGFGLLAMILSLFTPLLLMVHAFAVGAGSIIAIIALLFGIVIGSALIGWLIALVAAPIGRTLSRAAPVMAVPTFVLAAYVSWRSIFNLANALMGAPT